MVYALLDCSRFIQKRLSYLLLLPSGDTVMPQHGTCLVTHLEIRRQTPFSTNYEHQPNGLTRNEIREVFGRNGSEAEISRALSFLLENGWVSCTQTDGWTPSDAGLLHGRARGKRGE